MVHFSEKFIAEMKTVRAVEDNVDGLIKSTYEKGYFDIETFNTLWTLLVKDDKDIQKKLKNTKERMKDKFIEEVKKTSQTIELLGILRQKISNNKEITEIDESKMKGYLYDITSSTNKLYQDYIEDINLLYHKDTILSKIRNFIKPFGKVLLTLKLATALSTNTMESSLSDAQKQENIKAQIEWYNKTHVNIPELGTIKIPDGYELYAIKDSALVTNYNPTGKGLRAGKNKDGSKYKETGLTSTGHDALHDFTGVATADSLIPASAIIYIPKVGWKIADDTGGALKQNAKKGITQIDVRTQNYKDAIRWGKQYKTAYIFVKTSDLSDKSRHDKVQEAKDLYALGIEKSFKKVS